MEWRETVDLIGLEGRVGAKRLTICIGYCNIKTHPLDVFSVNEDGEWAS